LRASVSALLALALAAGLRAHDIPNERVDRAIEAVVEPGRLRVEYEVSLTELTLARDLKRLGESVVGADRDALYRRYGEVTGPLNARGFRVLAGETDLELGVAGFGIEVEEHPRFLFRFEAALPPRGRLRLRDGNYVSSEGTSRLALRGAEGVTIEGYEGPTRIGEAEDRPNWMLSDAEEAATRGFDVWYEADGEARSEEALPPSGSGERATRLGPTGGRLGRWLGVTPGWSWLWLWFLAAGLGAAHAIQPGHGKAMVAAAALGSRLKWRGGVVLALAATAAHLTTVLALAGVLAISGAARPAELNAAVTAAVGFVIAAIGVWRVGLWLGGHDEHREAGSAMARDGIGGLLAAGFAAGAVPCWDAVALILLADVARALPLGIWLLSGFSAGMAGVLVGVGLLAGRIRAGVSPRLGRWLGLASGLVLTGIGLYLWGV
jgi:ABC-type nickel/cobalt efflux system permease component RcnA